MALFTPVSFLPSSNKISHQASILTMGSCFASTIGDQLARHAFRVVQHPFGITYHPLVLVNSLNSTYDAQAFNAAAEYGIYSLKAGRSLSLNGTTLDWEIVQLQVNVAEAGSYTIDAQFEDHQGALFLQDNLTGEVTDLTLRSYTFSSQAGIHTDRFELISSPSVVLGLEESIVLVYAYNDVLYIQQDNQENRKYQLFNFQGQQVLSQEVNTSTEIDLSRFPSGIYLVFDGAKTHKILLK